MATTGDRTYELVLSLSNGNSVSAGTFTVPQGDKGEKGDKGDKGDTGATGPQGEPGIGCSINGVPTALDFTSDPQEQIDTKATKSTTSGTLNYRGSSTGAYVKLGSVTIPKSGTLLMNVAQGNYSGNRLGLKASIASGGVAGNANYAESINTDTSSNPNLAVSIQGTVTAGAVVDIYGKVTTNSSGMVAYYTYTIID